MAQVDKAYHKLVNSILADGYWYDDPYRKGVRRKELATYEFKHDLRKGFPAMTTKSLYWKGVVGELLWFLRGETNITWLVENNINIWNKDVAKFFSKKNDLDFVMKPEILVAHLKQGATNEGDAGRIYGAQWRDFWGADLTKEWGADESLIRVDQLKRLINGMKTRPYSTDLIVNAWNPTELTKMALPPCHFNFQIVGRPLESWERMNMYEGVVTHDMKTEEQEHAIADAAGIPRDGFTLIWDQRSVDTFLGLPFNIASYGLLAHILGAITGMVPLEIVGSLRNVHIYDNAIDAIQEQMNRNQGLHPDCTLKISQPFLTDCKKYEDIDMILDKGRVKISDFTLEGYESYPPLKVEMLARD